MYDLIIMQITQSQHNLGRDEFNLFFVEALHFVQIIVDIPSIHILQEEVNSQLILEYILHMVTERMVSLKQDLFLNFDVLHLIFLKDHIFIQSFHRIQLASLIVLNQKDFSE
jgi:hypothetical protein